MLKFGPEFFFAGPQTTKLFNMHKVKYGINIGANCNLA